MELEIRTLGDEVLEQSSAPVDEVDDELLELVGSMIETLEAEPGRAGLAAPQIGRSCRLFVYDVGAGPRTVINPEIIDSENEVICEEGCLSIPGVFISIPRFEKVTVSFTTVSGHHVEMETDGFLAQLMQHETDHLNGILMIEHLSPEEKEKVLKDYEQACGLLTEQG